MISGSWRGPASLEGSGVPALGVGSTTEELAIATSLDLHGTFALIADYIFDLLGGRGLFAWDWSGVFALGVTAAGQELAVTAAPNDHRTIAFITDLGGLHWLLSLVAGQGPGVLAVGVAAAG